MAVRGGTRIGASITGVVLAASVALGPATTAHASLPIIQPLAAAKVGKTTLHRIVDKIPTYRPRTVRWRLRLLGRWGETDWNTNTITISLLVPLNRLYSVVVHEWSHELSVLDYHHDVWKAIHAMNHHFGGGGKTGLQGTEMAADCMAILQGATWTNYTSCHKKSWRRDARRLVHGRRI